MEYRLKDVLQDKGYIRGPFGSALKRAELKNNGIPVYEQQHAIYANRDFRYYIDDEKYNELKRFTVKTNDLIISCSGTIGKIDLIKENDEKGIISQALLILRPNLEVVNPKYLYYFFKSNYGYNCIVSRSMGSVQVNIAKREFIENIKINLPSKDNQNKIVKILENIDKKIELNNQINENLQGVIRNYYKEKVVNNSDFILKNMDELVEKTIGGDWGKEESTGNYNSEVLCIRGADIPEMDCGNQGKVPTRFILEKNLINKQLNGNEIIIEISGGSPTQSTGRCAYITNELKKIFDKPLICTNFCRAIKLKDDKYLPIFYMRLKELYSKNIMFLYENGTTGIKNLDLSSLMENEELSIISDEDINKFNELFYAINKKIIKNAHENRALEILRDTLLPKLMNGEIDLDKVEI